MILMDITAEKNLNIKVLVNKEVRDTVNENADYLIEDKLNDRKIVNTRVNNISETIKSRNVELKKAKKKYKLDKKACRKMLKAKIKEAKREFRKLKKEAKNEYKQQLKDYRRPVERKKEEINIFSKEKIQELDKLDEIRKEIRELQKYKAYIDMKYTSDREEYIDKSLIPRKLIKRIEILKKD